MEGLKRVVRDEPVIITDAVRLTLLAIVLIGLNLSDEAVIAITAAVGAILTVANRALVTPTAKAEAQVQDAKDEAKAEAIVERAMSPDLTPEEWSSLKELRAERDRLERRVR